MYTRRALALWIVPAALLAAQDGQPALQVTGAVKNALHLTAADLAKLPRASVRTVRGGQETVYQGVWIHDLLEAAGVPQGANMRGKALAGYVIAEAQDGYRVVFSLGELDPGFTDSDILIADTVNGKPPSGAQGRFRLVAPKDKAGGRSVRMLVKLEVVRLGN